MHAGLRAAPSAPGRAPLGSILVVGAGAALLLRSVPLVAAYGEKLLLLHSAAALVGTAAAGAAVFVLLLIGWMRRPAWTAAALGAIGAAMVVRSGNAAAFAAAAVVLGATLLIGDLVAAALGGAGVGRGDLSSVLAAGMAAAGLAILLLGEAGALRPAWLVGAFLAVAALRARRIPALARAVRDAVRLPRGAAPPALEAAWLAFAALVLMACWAAVQGPDVSWDGLAYHLPEARDIALRGVVAVRPDLLPHSLLWRNHDAYLSLGFFFGGERVVRFLQFAAGAAVFGAALTLGRRLRAGGSAALVVLALAAFPTAMLQLHATYVDWPAALLVTAAAAEIAGGRGEPGRLRLGAFLFGAAVATKVFALFALFAIALLIRRARPRRATLAVMAACALFPVLSWLAWSAHHAGSIFEPYAPSARGLVSRLGEGYYFRNSPASGESLEQPQAGRGIAAFLRLPFDVVFHSSRFEANRDGYNGVLVLLLLLGLAGWGWRRALGFAAVSLPFVVPWFLLSLPSIRYLFPVYPLYAVFTAEGVARLTGRFAGVAGAAAGITLLAVAMAFPVQFGSSGLEWRVAFGLISRDDALAARIPSWPFWRRIGRTDRAVLLGESDRFHCPAALAYRVDYPPIAAWGRDPGSWGRGLADLGIDWVVYRRDWAPEDRLIADLDDRLELVAESGPALLYRVRR